MTDKRLRLGLIGLGAVGELHLKAYAEATMIDVVAVCDTSAERMRAALLPAGVARYSNASEMLASEALDIACILTPPSSHESLVALCAARGVHVFCEKPLTLTLEAAKQMIATTESSGVLLFYGSSYRYLPAIQGARKIILNGGVGNVRLMREQSLGGRGLEAMQLMHSSHYPVGGPGGFAMGLADHGIHLIDVFGWMMNSSVRTVAGRANVSGQTALPEMMQMVFENGAIGHLTYDEGTFPTELPTEGVFSGGDGWDIDGFVRAGTWTKYPSSIHVYGTKGSLRIFHYANMLFHTTEVGIRQVPVPGLPSPYHFASQIDAFATDIVKKQPPSTSGQVGFDALQALLSCISS